jgi:hypothetical protein
MVNHPTASEIAAIVDGRRMAETVKHGSGRSPRSTQRGEGPVSPTKEQIEAIERVDCALQIAYRFPRTIVDTADLRTLLALAKSATAASPPVSEELSEAFDMAHALIQEAKGVEGPGGGFVTDHLDAAENWLDKAEAIAAMEAGEGR